MKAKFFDEHTLIIAEDQDEYESLPAWGGRGIVCTCFELSKEEKAKVLETGIAGIEVFNWGAPVQPMEVRTIKPEFPIDFRLKLNCNPVSWHGEDKTQTAILEFDFSDEELNELEKEGLLWIIIAVRDSALTPISMNVI